MIALTTGANRLNRVAAVLLGQGAWGGFAEPNLMGRFQVSSKASSWA